MRIETTKAVTAIGQVLQEQLDHGLLAPGSKLPAERKLSELFGTTRITVREALLQLEAQGQIYREERRGWFVATAPGLQPDATQPLPRDGQRSGAGAVHGGDFGTLATGVGGGLCLVAVAGVVERDSDLPGTAD